MTETVNRWSAENVVNQTRINCWVFSPGLVDWYLWPFVAVDNSTTCVTVSALTVDTDRTAIGIRLGGVSQ